MNQAKDKSILGLSKGENQKSGQKASNAFALIFHFGRYFHFDSLLMLIFAAQKLKLMKYRRLTNEELQELEKEFVTFLSSNHITADDWKKLKVNSPEKIEELIGMFSDIVFEKILKQVEFLEQKTPKDMRLFQLKEDKILMRGIRVEGETDLDFTQTADPATMAVQLQSSQAKLQMYTGERAYRNGRTKEAFELMQQGALISKDGALFKALGALS